MPNSFSSEETEAESEGLEFKIPGWIPEHLGVAGLRFARCRGVQGLLFEFCRSRLRVSLRYLRYGFTAQVWQKLRGSLHPKP